MSKKISDYIFYGLLIMAFALRIPSFLEHSKTEGQVFSPIMVNDSLTTASSQFPLAGKNTVLIFWATWCGPCTMELARINSFVEDNPSIKDQIIAVNMNEDTALVQKIIKEKDYKFKVIIDKDSTLSTKLKVEGTPTIVFINKESKIDWMTTGISAFLGTRLKSFLL